MWNHQGKREFTSLQVGFADEYSSHAKPGRKRPCLRVSSRDLFIVTGRIAVITFISQCTTTGWHEQWICAIDDRIALTNQSFVQTSIDRADFDRSRSQCLRDRSITTNIPVNYYGLDVVTTVFWTN